MFILETITGHTQVWIGKQKDAGYGIYGKYEISQELKAICIFIAVVSVFLFGYFSNI